MGSARVVNSPSRLVAGLAFALFLASPLILLATHFAEIRLPAGDETFDTLWVTFVQAFASASTSMIFGIAGAAGLAWMQDRFDEKAGRSAELFVLVPNLVPVLVLLLAVFKFAPFARGWTGVVFVHALLNSGLVAVVVHRLLRDEIGPVAELAWIEGASRSLFLLRGALPMIAGELRTVFLSVFALCFASFSIPLMIGGARATTLEVLIWQKVRIAADWPEAIGLAALQAGAVIALSLLLRRSEPRSSSSGTSRGRRLPLLGSRLGLALILLPSLLVVSGLFDSLVRGVNQLLTLEPLLRELPRAIAGSMLVGVGTGFLTAMVLFVIAYADPRGRARTILLGYVAPSAALTGFALLIAWRETGTATFAKLIIGLTLVGVPAFYRLRWDAALQALRGQRIIAWSLGASDAQIFREIVWPQTIAPACFIAGLASLWAWGDFAFSSIIAERSITVALLTRGLLDSYRLPAATALVWMVVLGGAMSFAFFMGVGRVLGAQSQT